MNAVIYLSGPISGDEEKNIAVFNRVAREMRRSGYTVINPAAIRDVIGDARDWAEYMDVCEDLLWHADAIAMLPGWEQSRGANRELGIAKGRGLMVFDAADLIAIKEARE